MSNSGRSRSAIGTAGGGKRSTVEYTRVIPKFIRDMQEKAGASREYDSFTTVSTRRPPSETPTIAEIDALRSQGFNVDVAQATPAPPPETTEDDLKSAPKHALKVGTHSRVSKATRRRDTSRFATTNRSKLSFILDSSDDDD